MSNKTNIKQTNTKNKKNSAKKNTNKSSVKKNNKIYTKKTKIFLGFIIAGALIVSLGVTGLILLFNMEFKVTVLNNAGLTFNFEENTVVKYGKNFNFSFTLNDNIVQYSSISKIHVNNQIIEPTNNVYSVEKVKNDIVIEVYGYGTNGLTILNKKTLSLGINESEVVIPNGIEVISNYAFEDKTSITKVTIPSSVNRVGTSAFDGCLNLEQIEISQNLTEINSNAFSGTKWLTNQPNGVVNIGSTAYSYKGAMPISSKINFEENTKSIAESAFANQTNLVEITTPKSLEIIMPRSFYLCTGLQIIKLESNVKKIGREAFLNTAWYDNSTSGFIYLNNWLVSYKGSTFTGTNVIVKENTIGIAGGTFNQAEYLTSVYLPNGLKYISDSAFVNCYILEEIILPETLETIGEYSFNYCKLKNLIIPKNVKEISSYAFDGCYYLENVTIKCYFKKLENIFSNCFSLKNVVFESEIKLINAHIFESSGMLESITFFCETPPEIEGVGFLVMTPANFKIYVPSTALVAYKSAEGWNAKADNIYPND